MPDPKSLEPARDLDEVLSDLAVRIERVKTLYEMYFMGIEKIPPEVARKEVTRAMLTLQQQQIRNTGLRFRFNTMLQKWNIYITYWNRTIREIEAGTYLPHLQKARRAAERSGKEMPTEMKPKRRGSSGELPAMPSAPPSVAPAKMPGQPPGAVAATAPPMPRAAVTPPPMPRAGAAPPPIPAGATPRAPAGAPPPVPAAAARPPVAATPRAPAAAPIPGMSEQELRSLHQKYVSARASTGEAGQVSYQALVNSLARQVPKLLEQPGVREVRFDVAVQQGKVVLKAFPKK